MTEDRRPSSPHLKLFDWKNGGPYRWKESFPLQPVFRPRRLIGFEGTTLHKSGDEEPPSPH